MQLYNLGEAAWEDGQSIVCALAQLRREGAVLSRSFSPCVCTGGRVNVEQDIDGEFCRSRHIPVFRRETQGSIICFANTQLELQMVLARDHRWLAPTAADNCRKILTPFLETCRELKLDAEYKRPAEIVVGGRRIASACVGQVHERIILAASLILEFNADLFLRVLNIKDRELAAQLADLIHRRRTCVKQELGELPDDQVLEVNVMEHLSLLFGEFHPAQIDAPLHAQMRDSAAAMFSATRPHNGQSTRGWRLDVGAGTELQQCVYKAPGGLLRATSEWQDGQIVHASLSGDFFCYPPGALLRLEQALVGVRADHVEEKLGEYYRRLGLVTPGVHAAHWAQVLAPSRNCVLR